MTSFGLFSVNQLSSHAHVSRTNYATALDAQDRLQKLHDPNAFQAAHPSGRLGRILEKQNGANTGDQGMDEAMSAGSLAVDGRPLSEDNLDEGIADAAASTSFVPIQPRQGVVPTITSSMPTMPVAQMSTQGSQPGVVTAPGAPPNPLHGTPQPLLPRYLDHSAQNLLYVPLQPNTPIQHDLSASQHAFPHHRPADSSLPFKRKRGRPKRTDPKNFSAPPLLPYPPTPLAAQPIQAPVLLRPHPSPIMPLPLPESRPHFQSLLSRDSAQSTSQSSAGSPAPHSTHLQHQDDSSDLKRKRGRPKKTDSNMGALDPSLSNALIALNHEALGGPDAFSIINPIPFPLSGNDIPRSSEGQEDSTQQQNPVLKELVAPTSNLQSTHKPSSAQAGVYSSQPDQDLAKKHAPLPLGQNAPKGSASPEPPTSAQPDQELGLSDEAPQAQKVDILSLVQKKKPGRPRKSVTNPQSIQPQSKSQPVKPGLADHASDSAQPHNSQLANQQKRGRGRPKILNPRTEVASPFPLISPKNLSDILLSSEDEGETPDPLSFDALIRADVHSNFSPEKSVEENVEQPDPAPEHIPQVNLEHTALTQNKPRGRPRKSGPINPNSVPPIPASSLPDEGDHLEIFEITETRMIQTKETKQVKLFLPNEEGPKGSQSEIEDDTLAPEKRRGRPKKSADRVVPTWAVQPEASADFPQIPESAPGLQEDNANLTPLKKPRGRPRKSTLAPEELGLSAQASEPTRSPSADHRQASESADGGTSLPPAKKPRGRPRKSEPIVRMVPSWGARSEGLQNPPPPVGSSPQIVHSPAPGTPLLMKRGPGRPRNVALSIQATSSAWKIQAPPDGDYVAGTSQDAMKLDLPTQSPKIRPGPPRRGGTINGVAPTPPEKGSGIEGHDSVSSPPHSLPLDDLPQEIKRKRGRPSKVAVEERASEAAKQELNLGSSLSPKPQTHEAAQSSEPAVSSSIPQKRRRGRPSRVDLLANEGENTTQAQDGDAMPTPVKRRPGRPRKSNGVNVSASGEDGEPQSCVVQ